MNAKIIAFAINAHESVNHKYDSLPYSVHLCMVAIYANKFIDLLPKDKQSDIVSACWLHDTIEDCRLTYNDILAISNPCIAELVYAVTNEKGRTRGERANSKYYKGIIDVPYATFVKLCDRLANIKYSDDVNSTMFHKYGKEHDHFLNELFPSGDYGIYEPMVIESKKLLRYNSLN